MRVQTSSILIFDADNTLWDTNAVFHSAQVAMLKPFELSGYIHDSHKCIEELRVIDRILMRLLNHNEYDFRLLASALVQHYIFDLDPDQAAQKALEYGTEMPYIGEQAFYSFCDELAQIPPLLPGVYDTLTLIHNQKNLYSNIVSILFSEGKYARLEKIMEMHDLKSAFNEVVISPKSKDSFDKVKNLGNKYLQSYNDREWSVIVVGDSLKKDIHPAKLAGCITIYIPGAFQGIETPQSSEQIPDFQLSSMIELPNILKEIGLII